MKQYTDAYFGDFDMWWTYNCGWHPVGCHPYRNIVYGDMRLSQPVGILDFYKYSGVLPNTPVKTNPNKG